MKPMSDQAFPDFCPIVRCIDLCQHTRPNHHPFHFVGECTQLDSCNINRRMKCATERGANPDIGSLYPQRKTYCCSRFHPPRLLAWGRKSDRSIKEQAQFAMLSKHDLAGLTQALVAAARHSQGLGSQVNRCCRLSFCFEWCTSYFCIVRCDVRCRILLPMDTWQCPDVMRTIPAFALDIFDTNTMVLMRTSGAAEDTGPCCRDLRSRKTSG